MKKENFSSVGEREDARLLILRCLSDAGGPLGAGRISEQLQAAGHRLQPRTVRLRLLALDREGLTRKLSRRLGRVLTDRGRDELQRAQLPARVGFMTTRIETLMHSMTYRFSAPQGTLAVNAALFPEHQLQAALECMYPVFQRRLAVGSLLAVARGGMRLAGVTVPDGQALVATVCSFTVNGVLLAEGIPVSSRYGALLEMRDGRPLRFVELIEYAGATLAPLELFVEAGRTSVRECARSGNGIIGVSFREVPAVAREALLRAVGRMEDDDLGAVLAVGHPGRPLLGVPVADGRCGLVVTAGLNPLAALREGGLPVSIRAQTALEARSAFVPIATLRNRFPWWPPPRSPGAPQE